MRVMVDGRGSCWEGSTGERPKSEEAAKRGMLLEPSDSVHCSVCFVRFRRFRPDNQFQKNISRLFSRFQALVWEFIFSLCSFVERFFIVVFGV